MRAASAIGITATHIGVLKRLAVIELAAADGGCVKTPVEL
jgi:peptide deformylase